MGCGLIIFFFWFLFVWIVFFCDFVCIIESSLSIGVWFYGGVLVGEGCCWDDIFG